MTDQSYPASWQNRFYEAVDRAPVPNVVVYLLLFGLVVLVNHLVPWAEGRLPWGTVDPYQLNSHIWLLTILFASDYFLSYARTALGAFRPAMDLSDEAFGSLQWRFTHLSARSGWVITFLAVVVAIPYVALGRPYQQAGASEVALAVSNVLVFSFVFFAFAFLIRGLRMISLFHERIERVNIFHLQPLHAFSGLTSRVAVFFILSTTLSYLTNLVFADSPQSGSFAFFFVLNIFLASLAFVVPLLGLHQRLLEEKELVSRENDRRLEAAYHDLHRRVDAGQLGEIGDVRQVISALLEFRREIEAVSTWPWAPGTLRGVLSAILLPLAIYLVQRLLSAALSL